MAGSGQQGRARCLPIAGEEHDGNPQARLLQAGVADLALPSLVAGRVSVCSFGVWEQREPLEVTGNACHLGQALVFLEKPFSRRQANPIRGKQV